MNLINLEIKDSFLSKNTKENLINENVDLLYVDLYNKQKQQVNIKVDKDN
jgi:hypothetical protein